MKNLFFLSILAVIACSAVSAQQVTEFRQPGDVLRFEVKLDGSDASKVKTVSLYFGLSGQPPKDQPGFDAGFSGNRVGPSSLNTFIVEAKIPGNVVTGDYALFVNALAASSRCRRSTSEIQRALSLRKSPLPRDGTTDARCFALSNGENLAASLRV